MPLQRFFSLCLILSGILASLTSVAQRTHLLPFRLTENNNLVLTAILNEKDTLQLMFHTAATGLTITEEAVKRLKSVRFNDSIDSISSWGGSANTARVSTQNSLTIGSLQWKYLSVSENLNSGPGTDGKFGMDFFAGKVVEIDYTGSRLIIQKKLPRKRKKYVALPLQKQDGLLFVEARSLVSDSVFDHTFLIHSAYSGAVLYDDSFAARSRLSDRLKITGEKRLTDSYGNVLISRQAFLPVFLFAGFSMPDVTVGFFGGSLSGQAISVLGGEVMKQFNWIFDEKREFVYVQKR